MLTIPIQYDLAALGPFSRQDTDEIVNAHRDGRMTLAIVNRVDRAQALRDAVEKRLQAARDRLTGLTDVAPVHLPPPGDVDPPRRVTRRKDLDDLFDTDLDLTGFDVDLSPYVRHADDMDIRVLWCEHPSVPHRSWSWAGRGRRARSSQLEPKDRCDEASGGPPPCELLTERHGSSHAATRWNAMAA